MRISKSSVSHGSMMYLKIRRFTTRNSFVNASLIRLKAIWVCASREIRSTSWSFTPRGYTPLFRPLLILSTQDVYAPRAERGNTIRFSPPRQTRNHCIENTVESTCRLVNCQLSVIVQCFSGCVIGIYIMWFLSTVFSMQWFRVCLGGEKRIVFPRSAGGVHTSCYIDSINTPSQFGFCLPYLTRQRHVAQRIAGKVWLTIAVCGQEVAWVPGVS